MYERKIEGKVSIMAPLEIGQRQHVEALPWLRGGWLYKSPMDRVARAISTHARRGDFRESRKARAIGRSPERSVGGQLLEQEHWKTASPTLSVHHEIEIS